LDESVEACGFGRGMAPELFGGVAIANAIAGGVGHCGGNWTGDWRQKTIKKSDLAGGNVYAGVPLWHFPFLRSVGGYRMHSDGGDSSVAFKWHLGQCPPLPSERLKLDVWTSSPSGSSA
jgi:hypothetical protein